MTDTTQFIWDDEPQNTPGSNAPPECSVSELSFKLKRFVEDEFSFVRVRGEISRVTVAKSGHLYTSLKDDKAVIDAICWKGTVSRLNITPEEGLEVICTGKLTTYPGRSNYQLIIETMELAGEGALLKMLEERRKKLAAEGLFDESRKKPLPLLPQKIGVVTSPTGAVIRDIMHRLNDRFPRHVLLWPVMVQGKDAARQVTDGINGFNNLPPEHKPDLIIVARGGGSLEDLMAFNEEDVVRATAQSDIPIISAVGHETDTTLIDYASDLRAPTPTGAAEKAVPVRHELQNQVSESQRRLLSAVQRQIDHHKTHLQGLGRGLGDPKRLFETVTQRLDHASHRLDMGLQSWIERKKNTLTTLSAQLSPQLLLRSILEQERHLNNVTERLNNASRRQLQQQQIALQNLSALLKTLSFENVLERGFALVRNNAGSPITEGHKLSQGDLVSIQFKDGKTAATIGKTPPPVPAPVKQKTKKQTPKDNQGDLF